jgi:DNA-binding transcriptional ArsR family regulator
MKPKDAGPTAETRTADSGFDTWRALQEATDTKRANLIADIVGHPRNSTTVEELDYMNPGLSDDAIRRHLDTLQGAGVVAERALDPGERHRDYPYKFYEVTDEARALFDRNGLFPEEAWTRQYRAVEKTPRIRDVEAMPRPSERDGSEIPPDR